MKPHLMPRVSAAVIVVTVVSSGRTARADWTYVNFHPAGLQNSSAPFGVADKLKVFSQFKVR